jgi:hypothetical protein
MLWQKIVSRARRTDSDKALDKKRKHSIKHYGKFNRKAQRLAPCPFNVILKLNCAGFIIATIDHPLPTGNVI